MLRQRIEGEFEERLPRGKVYEDIEGVLEVCSKLKDEMVTVS
jgi:hypothetical protein